MEVTDVTELASCTVAMVNYYAIKIVIISLPVAGQLCHTNIEA